MYVLSHVLIQVNRYLIKMDAAVFYGCFMAFGLPGNTDIALGVQPSDVILNTSSMVQHQDILECICKYLIYSIMEPMLTYHQMDPSEQMSVTCPSKIFCGKCSAFRMSAISLRNQCVNSLRPSDAYMRQ